MTKIHMEEIENIAGELCMVMWADVQKDDKMIELLADEKLPEDASDDYWSDAYLRLLAEIHEQAEEFEIDIDDLIEPADWSDLTGEE